ncbi:MAG: hypothetical protein AAF368_03145, partial [Planctomycetota bacterium]
MTGFRGPPPIQEGVPALTLPSPHLDPDAGFRLVGVDGGATRVRAQTVAYEDRVDHEPLLRPEGPRKHRLHPYPESLPF